MPRAKPTIAWAVVAVDDLAEALAFIAADDGKAADRMEDRILAAVELLGSHPARGRRVPELLALGVHDYREVIVAPYRVVYRSSPRRLVVLAVLHGARDAQALLLRRLTRPR